MITRRTSTRHRHDVAVIAGLLWLLGCQLVGELVVRALDLPVPGAVLGMVLLFAVLRWRKAGEDAAPVVVARYLLDHLQLFFVPAGVGVVVYLSTVRDQALPIVVGLAGSWLLGLVTVAGLATLMRWRRADPGGLAPERIE